MMKRFNHRLVDGVLLLNKPFGLSSNRVLQKARSLYQARKAGHTGNLDPNATGLLPICFGEATKFSQQWLDADKGYRATIRLGAVSATGDSEGAISCVRHPLPTESMISAALHLFQGEISQIPPMHSALKFQGKPLYQYARNGEQITRAARTVIIKSLNWYAQPAPDVIIVDVLCTKGTYIRVLAEDIGQHLGCGAYLMALERTITAGFKLDQALTLSEIEALSEQERDTILLPIDTLLSGLEKIILPVNEARSLLQGIPIALASTEYKPTEYRLYVKSKTGDNSHLIGLGTVDSANRLLPKRMLTKIMAAIESM